VYGEENVVEVEERVTLELSTSRGGKRERYNGERKAYGEDVYRRIGGRESFVKGDPGE
jgi:hypothetical protein